MSEDEDRPPNEERSVDDDGEDGGRAPLDELAQDVRQRRENRSGAASELFEEVDVDGVDPDAVWESLLGTDDPVAEDATVGVGAEAERIGSPADDDRAEFIVPKAEFCERCPHLSAPPELACEREETDIVRVENSEHFRVQGCPFTGQRVDVDTFE